MILCNPVHGILQTRILEGVAMPSSKRSSWPRGQTYVSYVSCIGGRVLSQQHCLEASIHSPVLDMYVVSVSWRLWTLRCMGLFKVECTPDVCAGIGLLGHMVALVCFFGNLHTVLHSGCTNSHSQDRSHAEPQSKPWNLKKLKSHQTSSLTRTLWVPHLIQIKFSIV